MLEHPVVAYCAFGNAFEDVFLANHVSPRLASIEALLAGIDDVFRNPEATGARQRAEFADTLGVHYLEAFASKATDRVFKEINNLSFTDHGDNLIRPGEKLDPDAPFPPQQKSRVSLSRSQLISRLERITGPLPSGYRLEVDQLGESLFAMHRSRS